MGNSRKLRESRVRGYMCDERIQEIAGISGSFWASSYPRAIEYSKSPKRGRLSGPYRKIEA
jgi:hypothetical protein